VSSRGPGKEGRGSATTQHRAREGRKFRRPREDKGTTQGERRGGGYGKKKYKARLEKGGN